MKINSEHKQRIHDVLIEYGDLFPNEQVFTLEGTMNYIFKLLR